MLNRVKICGLSTAETVKACVDIGVRFIGFNFVKKSPRYVSIATAYQLIKLIPKSIAIIALVVDENDDIIARIIDKLNPDYLQLHGHETVERVSRIKEKFKIPIIKAFGVNHIKDIEQAKHYEPFIDIVLFDTKPLSASEMTGGLGEKFNWDLLHHASNISRPIMLAGGINLSNIKQALTVRNVQYLDICSGVEYEKGIKSIEKIKELTFCI